MGDWYFTYICLSVEKLQPTQRGSRLIIIARRFSCGTHDTCVMVFLSAVSQETLNKVLLTAILLRAALSAALLVCPCLLICRKPANISFYRYLLLHITLLLFYCSQLYPHNNPPLCRFCRRLFLRLPPYYIRIIILYIKNGHFHTDILHLFSCL